MGPLSPVGDCGLKIILPESRRILSTNWGPLKTYITTWARSRKNAIRQPGGARGLCRGAGLDAERRATDAVRRRDGVTVGVDSDAPVIHEGQGIGIWVRRLEHAVVAILGARPQPYALGQVALATMLRLVVLALWELWVSDGNCTGTWLCESVAAKSARGIRNDSANSVAPIKDA